MNRFSAPDAAPLFLHVTASVLVLLARGLPKAIHYASQLDAIDDPLHFGKTLTLGFAIFAEAVCPLPDDRGHRDAACRAADHAGQRDRAWPRASRMDVGAGQFAWMLLIMFGTKSRLAARDPTGLRWGSVRPGNGRPEQRLRSEPCHI